MGLEMCLTMASADQKVPLLHLNQASLVFLGL